MGGQDDKTRIFTAIRVPPEIAKSLLELPQKGVQGRWNNCRDLHITLRFIGDIQSEYIPLIKKDLERINHKKINIEIKGLDFFENPRQPILFADVPSRRKLENLVTDITDILAPYDIYVPQRPYKPHITLARLKKTPVKKVEKYVQAHSSKITESFKATSFELIRSGEPDKTGSVYSDIQSYKLHDF